MTTADEVIATAQALTRDRRHVNGLLAEVADSPTTVDENGLIYVRLSPALFAAIRRRAQEEAK